MQELLTKLALQVPDLAVLTLIVWMFLRTLAERDKTLADRDAFIKELAEENNSARTRSQNVIEKNSYQMGQSVQAMSQVVDALKQCTEAHREARRQS